MTTDGVGATAPTLRVYATRWRTRARYFASARFRLPPYRDRTRTFETGEMLPGIVGVPSPGHSAFRVRSEREEMITWGDTVHMPELQVPHPEVTMLNDYDGPMAAAYRRQVFEMTVRDGLVVGGMHLHFPGFARPTREREGFRLRTEPWAYEV